MHKTEFKFQVCKDNDAVSNRQAGKLPSLVNGVYANADGNLKMHIV